MSGRRAPANTGPAASFVAFGLTVACAGVALADDDRAAPVEASAASEEPSPERPLPDYDGRGKPPTTAGEDLLWVPRILLSPLYFTTEYVIRRPSEFMIRSADHSHVPGYLYDFFAFGTDHKAGIVPIAFFDFGFYPSVGVYAFWQDAGFSGHDLSGHFSIWPTNWIAGSLAERFTFGANDATLTLKAAAVRRPDRVFFGIGPSTVQADLSRYGETRIEGSATFSVPFWRSSRLDAGSGFRSVDIFDGQFGNDIGIVDASFVGYYTLPYGFGRGFSDAFSHGLFALDSRKGTTGSGVRLEGQTELGSDVRQSPFSGWIRYQGSAAAYLDLNGHGRVLSLRATALFADPLVESGLIPFPELVSPGGSAPLLSAYASGAGLMPGFYDGRLLGRSAAVASIEYRWPIWSFLGGELQFAAGNVFGEHLDDFRPGLLRMSFAAGFETTGVTDNPLLIVLGFGSETFADGARVDTARIGIGVTRF